VDSISKVIAKRTALEHIYDTVGGPVDWRDPSIDVQNKVRVLFAGVTVVTSESSGSLSLGCARPCQASQLPAYKYGLLCTL
jgi:hypothetical protein